MASYPQELSAEGCLERLASHSVGRVAFCSTDGPQIYPVNFVMDEGTIVFRTAAYGPLAAHGHNGEVAFEVDQLDRDLRQGWSVVAVGPAHMLDGNETLDFTIRHSLQPWAGGPRSLHVRVTPSKITGRQIHGDQ